ncbi:PAS domain-containing transcriptional regulator [Rhodoblastus sp.]|uniref:PAS domain-containing transcriptional regulator n=1 Tax=Rhodoblastus sp. TaxID=1962975 RepID=UPI0035ADEC08
MTESSDNAEARPNAAALSFEYRLQHLPVGVVTLDEGRRIVAANDLAREFLFRQDRDFLGKDIVEFHPPAARGRIGWLIESAGTAANRSASMIIATRMGNMVALATLLEANAQPGSPHCCLLFFMVETPGEPVKPPPEKHLLKLPIEQGRNGMIALVDVGEIIALRSQGHYASALMAETTAFCPRALSVLEKRLDPAAFLRVHRAWLVNINHIRAAERVDGAWWLILNDKARTRAPISRQKVAAIRRLLAV